MILHIRKQNLLKALIADWDFNPEFIKFLFFITNENVNITDIILEAFDANYEGDWTVTDKKGRIKIVPDKKFKNKYKAK